MTYVECVEAALDWPVVVTLLLGAFVCLAAGIVLRNRLSRARLSVLIACVAIVTAGVATMLWYAIYELQCVEIWELEN
ncbi:hypothetical protein [Vannielia litorea]|uniref:hypothetical protein n=1 Tax=Vannielia litorea TaxID=1217970 RepID=UPI001C97918E|nr:hypothetical protein [Vannielia litorea]MBY6049630.1 hypothetical protein [Vannielia litorea]MBY6077044.1 hypothetical protein [Vannielia litorea]